MQGWHNAVQVILHILRDPAMSSICSFISITTATLLARKSKDQPPRSPTHFKKIPLTTSILFTWGIIARRSKNSRPQEPQNLLIPQVE
jgi:hypothetical protein